MNNKLDFFKDLKKILNIIYRKKNDIFVFQTDIVNSLRYYNLAGPTVVNNILINIEKIFFDKTILFPAFSNDLALKKKYDVKLSKPYTGIIPNTALASNKYFRTESPLHSFLVKGKMLNDIKKLKQETTWGDGSIFDWLYRNNALWVSLNLDLNRGCAVHHMAEEKTKVPYRFYKIFRGKMYDNGKYKKEVFEKKFSYYKMYSKLLNYNKWTSIMREKKDFNKIMVSKGLFANISPVSKIVDRSMIFYKNNQYGSLNNK
tara:strand:- start:14878 stop:15654 length:777 start_codon:yes stop_codon:yes gene_type:complete